jgi:glycosyltransferase involved in cell wall biosynthesis
MTAATSQAGPALRRISSEETGPSAQAKKLHVIQLGSYPALNRGARTNLLTIHERLQVRGHESVVIDLTRHPRVKQAGVYSPRSAFQLARLLRDTPADVVHLHVSGALTLPKLALAAIVNRLAEAKTVCTLHLGGHFYAKRSLRARRWSAAGFIMRHFDTLVAINPEIASFLERLGVMPKRVHLIAPFPRLDGAESPALSIETEVFCRQHAPLIASVSAFEPGSELPVQFDILSKVRERYPSAGLLAIGGGSLHFGYMRERALHRDGAHIELTGDLSRAAAAELIRRAHVLLRTGDTRADAFSIQEALKAGTPIVSTYSEHRPALARVSAFWDVDDAALEVLRILEIARPAHEDFIPAVSDGADDMIRLYKQIAGLAPSTSLPAGYECPSIGWGL